MMNQITLPSRWGTLGGVPILYHRSGKMQLLESKSSLFCGSSHTILKGKPILPPRHPYFFTFARNARRITGPAPSF
jgi:hypothetical protein